MGRGGFRGGSRGSLEPPSGAEFFHFHGEFQNILVEIRQTNPPFLHLNPLFRNPGSAPVVGSHLYSQILTNPLLVEGLLRPVVPALILLHSVHFRPVITRWSGSTSRMRVISESRYTNLPSRTRLVALSVVFD